MRSLLRTIASLAMLASLALPLYTCHGYVAPDGHAVSGVPTGADSAAHRPTRIAHYPLEAPSPSELSFWVGLLAYAWPMLLLVIARSRRVQRHRMTLAVVRALMAIASGYVILFAMMWGDWAIGA